MFNSSDLMAGFIYLTIIILIINYIIGHSISYSHGQYNCDIIEGDKAWSKQDCRGELAYLILKDDKVAQSKEHGNWLNWDKWVATDLEKPCGICWGNAARNAHECAQNSTPECQQELVNLINNNNVNGGDVLSQCDDCLQTAAQLVWECGQDSNLEDY